MFKRGSTTRISAKREPDRTVLFLSPSFYSSFSPTSAPRPFGVTAFAGGLGGGLAAAGGGDRAGASAACVDDAQPIASGMFTRERARIVDCELRRYRLQDRKRDLTQKRD